MHLRRPSLAPHCTPPSIVRLICDNDPTMSALEDILRLCLLLLLPVVLALWLGKTRRDHATPGADDAGSTEYER